MCYAFVNETLFFFPPVNVDFTSKMLPFNRTYQVRILALLYPLARRTGLVWLVIIFIYICTNERMQRPTIEGKREDESMREFNKRVKQGTAQLLRDQFLEHSTTNKRRKQ